MALIFICGVVVLFAVLFIWEAAPETRKTLLDADFAATSAWRSPPTVRPGHLQ